jgi:hypothetical protein
MSITSAPQKRFRTHAVKWESLCARYLPITTSDSTWRYSRPRNPDDAEQGWKLHVSANILSANKTFARVAPYLQKTNVLFKAPCSLEELQKLNSGLLYGYSQVGKFITIYPRNASEAASMAIELDRLTTGLPPAPLIPFDAHFGPGSAVYYRYGSFHLKMADGSTNSAIRTPDGELIEDLRTNGEAKPKWVVDLFPQQPPDSSSNQALSSTPFRVIRALSQRGKGGVYEGIDFSVDPPRPCIIKQGRFGGEVSWDGKDGTWMLRNETQTLETLARAGIEVPLTYAKFRVEKNYYVVMERIEGETLQSFLEKRQRRLSIRQVLDFARQISSLLTRIHRAGWLWLDCKPANLMLTPNGKLRPFDFEGSCSLRRLTSLQWQTPAFISPRTSGNDDGVLSPSEDVYALGVTCYFLLTGQLPERSVKTRISRVRRHVPKQLQDAIELLLNADPRVRPRTEEVGTLLACC